MATMILGWPEGQTLAQEEEKEARRTQATHRPSARRGQHAQCTHKRQRPLLSPSDHLAEASRC